MSGHNLKNIVDQSWEFIRKNDAITAKYFGSHANGLGIEAINLLTDISAGKEQRVLKKLNTKTKRTLISFIKYFPLSDDNANNDIIDFLAEYCPAVLYEFCLINAADVKNHPLLDENFKHLDPLIKINPLPAITNRLNRLLENEKFSAGLLVHLRQNVLPEKPQFIFDLKNLPANVRQTYATQSDQDQRKFFNKHASLKKFTKSIIVSLFGFGRLYTLLYGSADPGIALHLTTLIPKEPESSRESSPPREGVDVVSPYHVKQLNDNHPQTSSNRFPAPSTPPRSPCPLRAEVINSGENDDADKSESASQSDGHSSDMEEIVSTTPAPKTVEESAFARPITPPRTGNKTVLVSVAVKANFLESPIKVNGVSSDGLEPESSPGGASPIKGPFQERIRGTTVTIVTKTEEHAPDSPRP